MRCKRCRKRRQSMVLLLPLRLLDRVERRFKKRKNAMAVSGRLGILRTK